MKPSSGLEEGKVIIEKRNKKERRKGEKSAVNEGTKHEGKERQKRGG